jgi:tRNA/tmRNA/rRNA uracil-C5-methylase (TrmA/RlmC/RlmD family)
MPFPDLKAGCAPLCPACSHREFTPDESRAQKEQWLKKVLRLDAISPLRTVASEARWHYRRKTTLHARWNGTEWDFGLLRSISPREKELVPIPRCPVHHPLIAEVIMELKSLPGDLPLAFLVVTGSLVTLVLKSTTVPPLPSSLEPRLRSRGVKGFFINLHPSAGNRVFAHRGWRRLWGEGSTHGPSSFQQLIPELYSEALSQAAKFLNPRAEHDFLDLYCGVGASIPYWSPARILGIEVHGESLEYARAAHSEVEFLQGRVEERIPQMESWRRSEELLLFANPPRLGIEAAALRWIAERARPIRIAYLSCSAGTLAKDLSVLAGSGYDVQAIQPYDFFPNTHHVEALVLLDRSAGAGVAGALGSRSDSRTHG